MYTTKGGIIILSDHTHPDPKELESERLRRLLREAGAPGETRIFQCLECGEYFRSEKKTATCPDCNDKIVGMFKKAEEDGTPIGNRPGAWGLVRRGVGPDGHA